MLAKIFLITVLVSVYAQDNQHHDNEEKTPTFWRKLADKQLDKTDNKNRAENIIFFVGAGMSFNTVTAARILKGKRMNKTGEEESLSFEDFPYTGWSKSSCFNSSTTDYACSGTALMCGVEHNIFTVGVNADVTYNNCSTSMDPKNHVSSIAQWAQEAEKSSGFITTNRITEATASALYAHVANRYYENDADVRNFLQDPTKCMDIATQLITQEPGKNFEVIMGGGLSKFLHNRIIDVNDNLGTREDNKYLLGTWQEMHPQGAIVTSREGLLNLNISQVSNIMGMFETDRMDYYSDADKDKQPTLAEMTAAALKLLQRNKKGYFLLIEGGLIDAAHHGTKTTKALEETLEFEKAIKLARDATDPADTLIVVAADHAHHLSTVDYLGLAPRQNLNEHEKDNFMGHHAGEDVPVYASGPYAHLFSGVMEQSTIPHLMAYAACIGRGRTMCTERPPSVNLDF